MLNRIDLSASIEEQCKELAGILGLQEPVLLAVLRAAVHDPIYAQNLLIARGEPRFLNRLIANPPAVAQAEEGPGLPALAKAAAVSLAKWARTGFSTVSDERYASRLEACSTCPHLRRPPEQRRLLYAVAGAKPNDHSVCGKCGCVVTAKAHRPHDTCPDAHPNLSDVNRWGEPLAPPTASSLAADRTTPTNAETAHAITRSSY